VVAEDTMEHLSGGDKERWVVEVSGDATKALGVLKTTDGALEVVEEAPGRFVVMMHRAEGAGAAISGGLTQAGLVVTRLSPQRQSLEEVFMSALSREREGVA
jgi:hypothetical protein